MTCLNPSSAPVWVKFFHARWSSDIRIRSVSLEDRGVFWGLWMVSPQVAGRFEVERWMPLLPSMVGAPEAVFEAAVRRLTEIGLLALEGGHLVVPDIARQFALGSTRRSAAKKRWSKRKAPLAPPQSGALHVQKSHANPSSSSSSTDRAVEIQTGQDRKGGVQRGEKTHSATDECCSRWERAWGRWRPAAWAWSAKARGQMASALAMAGGEVSEVERRVTILLTSTDQFYLGAASPGILLSNWNQLGFEVKSTSRTERALLEINRPEGGLNGHSLR